MNPSGKALIVGLLILCLTPAVQAAETETIPVDEEVVKPSRLDPYFGSVMEKFDFGAVNFLAGWTEVISKPIDHARNANGRMGRFGAGAAGLGEGLLKGFLNTAGGFANLVTAPLPQFRIPLPDNGLDVARLTASPAASAAAPAAASLPA